MQKKSKAVLSLLVVSLSPEDIALRFLKAIEFWRPSALVVILLHAQLGKEGIVGLAEVGVVDLIDCGLEEGGVDLAGFAEGEFGAKDLQDAGLVVQFVADALDGHGDDFVMVKGQGVGFFL